MRRFVERGPLTDKERSRVALLGDGKRAFDQGTDPVDGRRVEIIRLVILPAIWPRTENDGRRAVIEAWTSHRGTRWVEVIEVEDDSVDVGSAPFVA